MKLAKNKSLIRKINEIFDFSETEEDCFINLEAFLWKENSSFNEFTKSLLE